LGKGHSRQQDCSHHDEEIFLDSLIHNPILFRNDLTCPIAQDLDGVILRIDEFT